MRSLLWLALGAFAVGTEGFMIAGLLPRIAADLGVSVPQAGHLVTVFGVTYAIGSPIIAVLTGGIERKRLLLGALAAFALANLLAAWSPNFVWLAVSRALLALAAGAFMPAANAYAATTAAPDHRGRAISTVYTGFTFALVAGVPLGTLVGVGYGWRTTFAGVAVLALVAGIGIALALRPLAASGKVGLRERLAAARSPEVGAILLLSVIQLAGAFSVFTYFAPLLRAELGIGETAVTYFLLLFGAASFVGNLAGGYVADRVPGHVALRFTIPIVVAAFAALALAGHLTPQAALPVVAVAIAVWGVFGWSFLPIQQVRLAAAAPKTVTLALSLNASAIYVGVALGSTLGGLAAAGGSVRDVGWVGAALALTGLAWLALSRPRTRRAQGRALEYAAE